MTTSANTKNVKDYFLTNRTIGSIKISSVDDGSDEVRLVFNMKLTSSQKEYIKDNVNKILNNNFYGKFEVMNVRTIEDEVLNKNTGKFEDEIFNTLKIKVEGLGIESAAPTAVQEAGSAFIMTQVLRKNKKFLSKEDILNDDETNKGLEKIFRNHKGSIREWTYSYFEHQKAFFKKFQPSQWDVFEHGGQDLMSFIKDQCAKVRTSSGQPVGKYETWNPSDIWVVKNKNEVKKKINEAIKPQTNPPTARLEELNNVLLELVEDNKLIGLSLKKIDEKQVAKFKYVNISPKDIEFAKIEKIKMSDISFHIQTDEVKNDKGMMLQGAYVLFDDYRINVIRTPSSNFSNLKYESSIKGSGGRGGAAPVELVQTMMKKRGISFINDNGKYPKTLSELERDGRDYKKMFNMLKTRVKISGYSKYEDFEERIIEMYKSNDKKSMSVAQSKLMQLDFFYSTLSTSNGNKAEFWTDLLYLSLKVGKRFAPHGKLA
jgi:hypothetical protein